MRGTQGKRRKVAIRPAGGGRRRACHPGFVPANEAVRGAQEVAVRRARGGCAGPRGEGRQVEESPPRRHAPAPQCHRAREGTQTYKAR